MELIQNKKSARAHNEKEKVSGSWVDLHSHGSGTFFSTTPPDP